MWLVAPAFAVQVVLCLILLALTPRRWQIVRSPTQLRLVPRRRWVLLDWLGWLGLVGLGVCWTLQPLPDPRGVLPPLISVLLAAGLLARAMQLVQRQAYTVDAERGELRQGAQVRATWVVPPPVTAVVGRDGWGVELVVYRRRQADLRVRIPTTEREAETVRQAVADLLHHEESRPRARPAPTEAESSWG